MDFEKDPEASRTMSGETCEGVVEAALLVLAMSASGDDAEPPKVEPPEPPPIQPAAPAQPDRDLEPRPEAKPPRPFEVATGMTFAADAFSEGRWSFDVGASIALEWRRGALNVAWLKPRVALGASATPFDVTIPSPFATSDYARLMGFIEGCPTSHEIGQSVHVSFRPCGRITGSLISLETTSLIDPNTIGGGSFKTGTWSTAGALGRLRFNYGSHAPFLELFGGVDFTLTADRFRVLGSEPIGPDAAVAFFGLVAGTSW
ncbi:MAG: hypothetical protein JST00_31465 [Deltaproteobacteria bacterium]|nr:hypothetical protein [Deltaproteobacteria bacterium]